MRVKWEKRDAREFVAYIDGDTLQAWCGERDGWQAEYSDATGDLTATHYGLPSERAAKREARRMWRALRGSK